MDFASNAIPSSQDPPDQLQGPGSNSADCDDEATEDEHEDLPYDGILESYLVPSLVCNEESSSDAQSDYSEVFSSLEESLPINITVESGTTKDETLYSVDSSHAFSLSETIIELSEAKEDNEHGNDQLLPISTIIPDVLLRHFNEEGLLNSCEFIDYETMPEISITESTDETVISKQSGTKCSHYDLTEDQENNSTREDLEILSNENTDNEEELLFNETSDSDDSVKENIPKYFQQESKDLSVVLPSNEDETQHPKQDQERRFLSSDIKYGQGQVHYKLPDFSKVSPKVKIPKGDVNVKPVSTVKKAASSSSSLLGQSFIIQDILESLQPCIRYEQIKDSTISSEHQHTQISDYPWEYKDQAGSVVSLPTYFHQPLKNIEKQLQDPITGIQEEDGHQIFKSVAFRKKTQNNEEPQVPTEGENMSRMLQEQAEQLQQKVFQNLRSSLEGLEVDYLSTKEKHRDLQLLAYRTGSHTVGEFDLEREVEGQIYRLGMLLEDIQEQISTNDESLAESPPPIKSHDSSLMSHAEQSHQSPLSSPNMSVSEVSIQSNSELDFQTITESTDKLTGKNTSMKCSLPAQNLLSSIQLEQSKLSHLERSVALHSSKSPENAVYLEKHTARSKYPMICDRYQEAKQRKTKLVKPGKLSISIHEKELSLEFPERSTPKALTNPSWEKYRNGKLIAGGQSKLLNTKVSMTELLREDSRVPIHNNFLDRHHLGKQAVVRQFMPLSRYNVQASLLSHSQYNTRLTSALQRQSCSVKENHPHPIESKMLNSVLDQALRTAKHMRKTTERMIEKLTVDTVNSSAHHRSCHW